MNLLQNVAKRMYAALNVSFFFLLPFLDYVDCCTAVTNVKVHGRNSSISKVFKE